MTRKSDVLPEGLAHVVERLNAFDPKVRELAADQLSDYAKRLGIFAPSVCGMLVMVYLSETEKGAAVSQLDVLSEVCTFNEIPEAITEPVTRRLADKTCEEWEVEYIEVIADIISSRTDST